MKRILITGKDSYIGSSFESFIKSEHADEYQVDTLDLIDEDWNSHSFESYDVVLHVAGIAHIKETSQNRELYFKVNRDLAYAVASKAAMEGVSQFIYLSSMSVYGKDEGEIVSYAASCPVTAYGKSKIEAEHLLKQLSSDTFKIAILRPPMVYGYGCNGNFNALLHFAEKFHVFPYVHNQRSMIFIGNLVYFIERIIADDKAGTFFPQNRQYMNTSFMVKSMASAMGRKIYLSHVLGGMVILMKPFCRKLRKAFGSLTYQVSDMYNISASLYDNESSIRATVGKR